MRYFSMFSGIGGFELGIEQTAKELGISANCVGYSEIDPAAIATYKEHFTHDNYGSATDIDAGALPDFCLLVGGFPCQAFSIQGNRRGFDEARGTLFFDIARVLKAKHPQNFILENVKGLLSHDGIPRRMDIWRRHPALQATRQRRDSECREECSAPAAGARNVTPAEFYADEHRNLLAASNANLAATIRNRHNPNCPCHQDQAITEPINPEDAE